MIAWFWLVPLYTHHGWFNVNCLLAELKCNWAVFFPLLNCNTQIWTPTHGLSKPLLPCETAYERVTFQEMPTVRPHAVASAKVAATIFKLDAMWSRFWFRRVIGRIGRWQFGWHAKGRRKLHQAWSTLSWCDRQSQWLALSDISVWSHSTFCGGMT